jgi:uncharacterized protein (TIGR03435 family)
MKGMNARMRLGTASLLLACMASAAFSQERAAPPDPAPVTVASIKRNRSDRVDRDIEFRPGGRIFAVNVTLRVLLRNFNRLLEAQLVGGPDWVATERWDIVATVDPPRNDAEMIELFKEMLTERFALRLRREMRELPVYRLVVARADGRLGPQLRPSGRHCNETNTCGDRGGVGEAIVAGRTIGEVLRVFERVAGRPVINQTGLDGPYDFTLRWRPDDTRGTNEDLPSLFVAVEEQLGLKLVADRQPSDVLVIDAAERPQED